MSNLAASIEQEVALAVKNDQLELPTLPEVALRIRDEAEREAVTARSLGEVIADDPSLAGQIIKMANSPMYRGANTIEDLSMALSRLGVEYAASLATGLAMSQMFQATTEVIDQRLRSTWAHATALAGICAVLAKAFTNLRPDQASLAGLTHSIGVLPILTWAEDNGTLLNDSLTLDRVIESIHGSLGTMILQSWDFPDEIAMVPAHHLDFERRTESTDYVDVVMVANLQSLSGSNHPLTKLDWSTINAFEKLGLDPDPEAGDLDELQEDFQAAQQAFS